MTLMKLRLDLFFTDLSQHFRVYLVVFALSTFLFMGMGKRRQSHLFREVKV